MVIDTSAVTAILLEESDADIFSAEITLDAHPMMSAVALLEAHLAIRKKPRIIPALDRFVEAARIEIVPVDEEIVRLARRASDEYGKGTRANLNFGDLFSYATAKRLRMPLLFKGQDFVRTDIQSAGGARGIHR